ncbi:MAG: hypothetical protein SWJ54_13550 [Cyanobacteriota bacterium]|nr:hypothetical protein [Cyanobacteriota bacterium]
MTQLKFWMTALSTVSIAGSVVLGATSAEACLFNKMKSAGDSSNSPKQVSLDVKSALTSKEAGITAGIAAAAAGLFGLGAFYRSRREADQPTVLSFENVEEFNDEQVLHPEAPGGELDVTDSEVTAVEEFTQKEVALTK